MPKIIRQMVHWDKFRQYPPPLVRVFARRREAKRAFELTDQEIAVTARLPVKRIVEISQTPTWDEVPIGEARAFCRGCNFDPLDAGDRNRAMAYIRQVSLGRLNFAYLKADKQRWNNYYRPLIRLALPEIKKVTANA